MNLNHKVGHFRVNGNLSVHLSDGCINDTALLDTIGGWNATPEDFGDSCYTIFIMFLWHHLGRQVPLPFAFLRSGAARRTLVPKSCRWASPAIVLLLLNES